MVDGNFETLNDRVATHSLKTLKVICQTKTQERGHLVIKAPSGVTFDKKTNCFSPNLGLKLLGPPVLRDLEVCVDKVVNQGIIPVSLIDKCTLEPTVLIPYLEVPFIGHVDCPCALPNDIVQKHDVEVECSSLSAFCAIDPECPKRQRLMLSIVVVIRMCIIVARETIIKVEGAEPFCI